MTFTPGRAPFDSTSPPAYIPRGLVSGSIPPTSLVPCISSPHTGPVDGRAQPANFHHPVWAARKLATPNPFRPGRGTIPDDGYAHPFPRTALFGHPVRDPAGVCNAA